MNNMTHWQTEVGILFAFTLVTRGKEIRNRLHCKQQIYVNVWLIN